MASPNSPIFQKDVYTLLNAVTTNQTTDAYPFVPRDRTIEAFINGTGAVGATIQIYGCNTYRVTNGILLGTITLSGTNSDQAGSIISGNWGYMYVTLSNISGTNAAVTFTVGL